MYPAKASQVILIHCPSLLRTTVLTFLLSNPFPLYCPNYFPKPPIIMAPHSLSETSKQTTDSLVWLSRSGYRPLCWMGFPPFLPCPMGSSQTKLDLVPLDIPHPSTTQGLDSRHLIFLGFPSALVYPYLGKSHLPFNVQTNAISPTKSSPIFTLFQAELVIPFSTPSSHSIHSAHLLSNSSGRPSFLTPSNGIWVPPVVP